MIYQVSGMLSESSWAQSQITESESMFFSSVNLRRNDRSGILQAGLDTQFKQASTNSTAVLLEHSHYFLLWRGDGFLRMLLACNS